jgi:putative endonuclease
MTQIVYILHCEDNGIYIGCTENLEARIQRHNNGQVPATKNRIPVKLITHILFQDKYKAFAFEKYLKSGSGRAFINKHLI